MVAQLAGVVGEVMPTLVLVAGALLSERGGAALRPVMGPYRPRDFVLQHSAEADGFLFFRYRKVRQ